LRKFRVVHRYLGLTLAIFLLISAVTGILLSLKKDIAAIQPVTQKGVEKDLQKWKPLPELAQIAKTVLAKHQPDQMDNPIDRMDVRPSKGIVKVLFKNDNWEVQLDGSTGTVKSIDIRYSDWIESIHDGSIVSDAFKLVSMNFLGWGALLLIVSGFWLWYGPKRLRFLRRKRKQP